MVYYLLKLVLSAGIIVLVSEIAKRSTLIGAIIASLPLVTLLSMIWLYLETKDAEKIAQLSMSIFWLVLPSLTLLIILPQLIALKVNFYLSLTLASTLTVVTYWGMIVLLKKIGVSL